VNEYKRNKMNECYHCKHRQEVAGNAHIQCVKPDADMVGSPHGIRNGWFYYPLLFDPTWKEVMCKNYEANDSVKTVVSNSVSAAGESK
jgi:hypothetical protein